MPGLMTLLTVVGTAAMLWVGGSIILHGLEEMGVAGPAHLLHGIAHAIGQGVGAVEWGITALLDGLLGIMLGLLIVPVVTRVTSLVRGG
jgi:predicted DNA repair protein MutK